MRVVWQVGCILQLIHVPHLEFGYPNRLSGKIMVGDVSTVHRKAIRCVRYTGKATVDLKELVLDVYARSTAQSHIRTNTFTVTFTD